MGSLVAYDEFDSRLAVGGPRIAGQVATFSIGFWDLARRVAIAVWEVD